MEHKEDKRVRRSKKRLRQALARLMQQKAFPSITVTDVVREADLNRGTFYAHYHDIDDMRAQIENELLSDFRALLGAERLTSVTVLKPVLERAADYVQEQRELFMVLLHDGRYEGFAQKLTRLLEDWRTASVPYRGVEDAYVARFAATGVVGVIERWVTEPQPLPKHELIALLEQILLPMLRHRREKKHPAYRY